MIKIYSFIYFDNILKSAMTKYYAEKMIKQVNMCDGQIRLKKFKTSPLRDCNTQVSRQKPVFFSSV